MKTGKTFKYIYGPVCSWRLGLSLGIDLFSGRKKVCNLNCVYCQLGQTPVYTKKRKIFIPTQKIMEEIKKLPPALKIDYITISGRGEPTLARNLGEVIRAIKRIRSEPVAVLTNALLLNRKDVRQELALADFIIVKLDAFSENSFKEINRPITEMRFKLFTEGIRSFKKDYSGTLAIRIMFIAQNEDPRKAEALYNICKYIEPDEVLLNTPLRPCAVKPLSKAQILKIKKQFKGLNAVSVYEKTLNKKIILRIGNAKVRRGTKY